ncbi:MAG: prepilin-type N-terminal cleavage/methylation domain-containing protein [Gemmatimonadales bacterium]|nr:prepilin-type N-terminal cleavage/methylation domain-containing protein [Gemmatimonadales bacterium]
MNRRGFTLVEVMVAMVILLIVVVGIGKIVGSFIHAVGTSTTRTVATTVAVERLDLIRGDPTYPLPASWSGTATGFPGYPNMSRQTVLNRVTGATPPRDYTRVSVKVWEPSLRRPGATTPDTVNLTSVVARP